MKLVVTNLDCLHPWDKKRLEFAIEGANRILASPLFKTRLLEEKLTETNGLTNLQVYEKIMAGDQLNPFDKLGETDIKVMLYRKTWSRVVGYTFIDSVTVWMNRKFFGQPKGIGSNLIHEACGHQNGFLHQGRWATAVPYVLNRVTEELWDVLCVDIDEKYLEWWYS